MNLPSDNQKAMQTAIAVLYATFEHYRLQSHVEECDCCLYTSGLERLHSRPLRRLTADYLSDYAFSILLTWGTNDDFKHLLPRLFELIADGAQWWLEPEWIFYKLQHSGWNTWPQSEQIAVELYLMALWQTVLAQENSSSLNADSCLCGIAQAVDDLRPFLEVWQSTATIQALRHLIEFIEKNINTLSQKSQLSNTSWKERQLQSNQVIDWLLAPLTVEGFRSAAFENYSDRVVNELTQVVDHLSYLQKLKSSRCPSGVR